jgi:hypothetical protein
MDGSPSEDRIRERAYDIWLRSGQPEGRAEGHWSQAELELAAEADTEEHALDSALDDSFPASDPPAMTQPAPSAADKAKQE